MYECILVPTDGSDATRAPVEHAIDLATTYDAALHALNVVDTNLGFEASAAGTFESLEETGKSAVENVVREAESAGVDPIEGNVVHGTPHEAILEYVDDNDIDLVVMGTHGRTGLDRYLLGSVTEKVVRLADVPVLTVGLPAESDEED